MAKEDDKESKKGILEKEEHHPERRYGVVDEVEIAYKRQDRTIDKTVLRATDSGKYVWQEKIGKDDVNPDKVVVMRVSFPHIGKIEIYYYSGEPTRLWIATKSGFDELNKSQVKTIWSGIVRAANLIDLIGQYTKKAQDKRWKHYKDKYRELRRKMKEQNVKHESEVV